MKNFRPGNIVLIGRHNLNWVQLCDQRDQLRSPNPPRPRHCPRETWLLQVAEDPSCPLHSLCYLIYLCGHLSL